MPEDMENQEVEKEQLQAAPEVEVEVVDDTPEEDREAKKFVGNAEPTEEELENYSESVKKRIQKLTHARHDERRAKEKIARERDELAALARRLMEEKKSLQEQYYRGEEYAVSQIKQKADLQLDAVKRRYKEAFEAGDADGMADAQAEMSRIALEKAQFENWQPKKTVQTAEDDVIIQKTQVQPEVDVPKPDDRTLEWAEKNTWFGPQGNKRMTAYAYGVHEELVEQGVDPRVDPDRYYAEIDRAMREAFPDKFEAEKPKKAVNATVVAPVHRTANGKTKVTLTTTQERIAKRLGISKEQYARELAKLEALNG